MSTGTKRKRASTASPRVLVRRLGELKSRFSPDDGEAKLDLLDRLRRTRILDPRVLLDYHEILLFIRAYPDDRRIFQLASRESRDFGARVRALRASDSDAAAILEDTGIAETGMYYRYDYAVIIWLVKWFGAALDIDWDEFEDTQRIDQLLPVFIEWIEHDGLDLAADVSTREWIELCKGDHSRSALQWFLKSLRRTIPSYTLRMSLYDSLDLPIVWRLGNSPASRTRGGAPSRSPYMHRDGLLKKVPDFRKEIARPLPDIRRADRRSAASLIKTARCALAVRHRALYPLDYANRDEVLVADVGRGYQIILFGMEPRWRLPIESDYGVLVLKNGFVFGYGVGTLLFEQVEIAVNIFDAWRGGESRFVFTQFVRTFHSHFGCSRFKIERYQVGYESDEGIQSGSFWFYYRLGFVPKLAEVRRLARKEQAKINRDPSYRCSVPVLEKLSVSDLYLSLDGDSAKVPDDFPLGDLSLRTTGMIGESFDGDRKQAFAVCSHSAARSLGVSGWKGWPDNEREWFGRLSLVVAQISDLHRWSRAEKQELVALMRAKGQVEESGYVRRMNGHRRLRDALLKIARG